MKCETLNELLPWYLNGSLTPDERAGVDEHLAGCERCRRELEATRQAARIYLAHPSAEALVDHAYGRPSAGLSSELIDEHVAACVTCAEELALIRQSRTDLEAEETPSAEPATSPGAKVLPGPWQRVSTWRWASIAAGLGFTVAMSGLLVSQQRGAMIVAQQQAAIDAFRTEVVQMKGQVGGLNEQLAALGRAGGAGPTFAAGAFPISASAPGVTRSEGQSDEKKPFELVRQPGFSSLVLELPDGAEPSARYRVELRDASGTTTPLDLQAQDGGLWLAIATEKLAPGRFEIDLYPENGRERLYRYIGSVR